MQLIWLRSDLRLNDNTALSAPPPPPSPIVHLSTSRTRALAAFKNLPSRQYAAVG
ncbi:deoxyribodipyrimidine photolyase [Pseudomonas baetica]|nr:deoxyribodipyrimidine photolyase [Pseudomonas baetica]